MTLVMQGCVMRRADAVPDGRRARSGAHHDAEARRKTVPAAPAVIRHLGGRD